jgi:DNA-binding transcriptional LysR family regulator
MNEWDSLTNDPLDTRQLLAFLQLSRTASFTGAARALHLSQSAVSHSIKALEETVGCRLFDRLGKRAVLTQAGEQLLHHVEKILREMTAARQSLLRLGKWGQGRLRIGASPTACQYIIPSVLREFRESFPDHQISLQPGDTPVILEALREDRLDLAVALEPRRAEDIETHALFEDELQFIVAPTHPWATARKAVRDDIARQNYLLYHRTSQTFRMVDDYFRSERMVLKTVMELGSMEAIKELVKLGLGISILAPWIVQAELAEGALVTVPLGRRKLARRWSLLQVRGRPLGLAGGTFLGLCRSVAENLPRAGSGLEVPAS